MSQSFHAMLALLAWVGLVTAVPAIGCGIVGARLGASEPQSFRRIAHLLGRVVALLFIIVLWTRDSAINLLWLIMLMAFGVSWSCFLVGGLAAFATRGRDTRSKI